MVLKLELEEIKTQHDPKGLESAFQTAKQKRVNAIMTLTSRQFFAERKLIVDLADKYRLPAIYFQKEFVDEGGLMSYGADFNDLYRRAAVYVDKILKGAKPADLPVQQATKFEFVIEGCQADWSDTRSFSRGRIGRPIEARDQVRPSEIGKQDGQQIPKGLLLLTAYCPSVYYFSRRGAAANENPTDRDPSSWFLCFPRFSPLRFIPARTPRIGLH
jgi:hypothetical protein